MNQAVPPTIITSLIIGKPEMGHAALNIRSITDVRKIKLYYSGTKISAVPVVLAGHLHRLLKPTNMTDSTIK